MPTEIERKFLVVGEAWRAEARASYPIRQGYLARGDTCTVRIRRIGDRAYVTVKSAKHSLSRSEYEYEIPAHEADEMLDTLTTGQVIEKRRHCVPHDGRVWEVDEFEAPNAGLVVAEIELRDIADEPRLPDWVGEEVTEDRAYGNAQMSAPGAAPVDGARAEARDG